MREGSKGTPIEIVTERLKLLPRRHRIAHLRALVGRQLRGSIRERELAGLLHDEMTAQAGEGGRLR
jgi:hypothetical protein